MVRKTLALLASLTLLVIPLVFNAQPALASVPAAYAVEPAYATISFPNLGGVRDFVSRIWEAASCVTDIDCLIGNAMVSIANSGHMFIIGVPFDDLTGDRVAMMMDGNWNTGLAFAATGAIDGAYLNPPGLRDLHLTSHLRHELSDNLLSGKVYAKTAGETVLGPIEEVWTAVRNLAYGLFMLVMIAIGFMIMLRKQIAPRVVVSFTNALPRIVMGLILITFSFSLIALAFDIVGVFGSAIVTDALPVLPPGEEIPIEGGLVGRALGTGAGTLIGESLYGILKPFLDLDPAEVTSAQALQAALVSFTFLLLLALAAIGVAIQLVFRIAKLLIKTVLSPIFFLFGSLPGQEGSITAFAKGIIADCAAFPAIAFMFSVTRLFLKGAIELSIPTGEGIGVVQAFYGALTTLFLTIIFLVMTIAAPMFVGKLIETKR